MKSKDLVMKISQWRSTRRVYGGSSSIRTVLLFIFYFSFFVLMSACHYPRPDMSGEEMSYRTRDSLTHLFERNYTYNTNLELKSDSLVLERLPVKDRFDTLRLGARVVVAEFAIHPADSVDSVWVKLAHTQDIQGWVRESEMIQSFVPTDSLSQAIYLFSDTYAASFIIIFALFVTGWLVRAFMRKQLRMVYFNDIDSLYPLLLCLLMAFSATIYESMQVFVPDTWEHFYFNPTLSPLKVPFVLSVFLLSLWAFVVVLLAVIDESFRQLTPAAAVVYLLGVATCCIFCYFFFILTTHIYTGYLFLTAFVIIFAKRAYVTITEGALRCGKCGAKLHGKGTCAECGAVNE